MGREMMRKLGWRGMKFDRGNGGRWGREGTVQGRFRGENVVFF